jgi:hypothetical protein
MCNNAVGLVAGIGCAALSLGVLAPADPDWRRQRALRRLMCSLEFAAHARMDQLQPRFESRVRDLTLQAMALRPVGRAVEDDEALGFVILDIGDALIRWRTSMVAQAVDPRATSLFIDATLEAVARRDERVLGQLARELEDLQVTAARDLAAVGDGTAQGAALTERLAALRTLRAGLIGFGEVSHAA